VGPAARARQGTRDIAPLTAFRDRDKLGLLTTCADTQLPSTLAALLDDWDGGKTVQLLARQPIDPDRPHPFTRPVNTEFNCLLWLPPNEKRAGDIVMVDSTNFTTLFGGTGAGKFLEEYCHGKVRRSSGRTGPCQTRVGRHSKAVFFGRAQLLTQPPISRYALTTPKPGAVWTGQQSGEPLQLIQQVRWPIRG